MFIEITIKSLRTLPELIEQIKVLNPSRLGLSDKNGMPDNLLAAEMIKSELPELDIITYYSLKNHTSKFIEQKYENLKDYLDRAETIGVKEVLLVSGSPKPKFDSLQALEFIKTENLKPSGVKLSVAYNPFLELDGDKIEKERLEAKLKLGLVDNVYLQIGDDIEKLKNAIKKIKSDEFKGQIYTSILVATDFILGRFNFKPWNGVNLSSEYLKSAEGALIKNQELLKVSKELEIQNVFSLSSFSPEGIECLNKLAI